MSGQLRAGWRIEIDSTQRADRPRRWRFTIVDDEGIFAQSGYRYASDESARRAGRTAVVDVDSPS
jgi:hypothetical protein